MINSDRLDFLNPRFCVEGEIFSQSSQLSINQIINSPGISSMSKGLEVLLLILLLFGTYTFLSSRLTVGQSVKLGI